MSSHNEAKQRIKLTENVYQSYKHHWSKTKPMLLSNSQEIPKHEIFKTSFKTGFPWESIKPHVKTFDIIGFHNESTLPFSFSSAQEWCSGCKEAGQLKSLCCMFL